MKRAVGSSRSISRRSAVGALMVSIALAPVARAATPLESLRVSPDVTTTLAAVAVHDEDIGEDDLAGGVTLVGPLDLPAAADVVGFHSFTNGDQLLSFDTTVTLPGGIVATPRDVARASGGVYSIELDGTLAGIPASAMIDALAAPSAGGLLLSYDTTIDLFGTVVDDEDVVHFDGAAFEVVFDGSAAGVPAALDVDGLHHLGDGGRYLLSFDGSGSVGGVAFDDEDVLEHDPASGSWELAYDGSAQHAEWSAADLDALDVTSAGGQTPPVGSPTPPVGSPTPPAPTATPTSPSTPTPTRTPTLAAIPAVSINDVKLKEGPRGSNSPFTFTVTLSTASKDTVRVPYRTADGTAVAASDYTVASGTLTFAPGTTSQTVTVTVIGDDVGEKDETFFLNLSAPSGATIADAQGIGTIVNDDVGVSELIPRDSSVEVGERHPLTLRWTHPERWRALETLHLRLVAEDGTVVIWARFTEASNELALCTSESSCGRGAVPGTPLQLQSGRWASLDVGESRVVGSGPEGPSVDVTFVFRFKPQAGGRIYRAETLATDDSGNRQGFETIGMVTVEGRKGP